MSRGAICFGVYPFPDGSADLCQIWGQSVQPFDSFPRLFNFWHPNPSPPPEMPPGVLRGHLYLAYVHSQMNPQTWTKVGANRTASPDFWIVDPLKTTKCPPCVSRGNLYGVYIHSHMNLHMCANLVPIGPAGLVAFPEFVLLLIRLFAAVCADSRKNTPKNNIYTSKIIIPARTCRHQRH